MSRFGSKADICVAKSDVRFTPESGHVQRKRRCPLRANPLYPKANICSALGHVRFGPKADIGLRVGLCRPLLGAGPPVCRFIADVNVKDNLVLAPGAANSMLANVGFAAVQKPTFYRKRAQVAEGFANRCRDETAKQMLQRVAERWRELARLAGSRKSSRASSKPKKRKPR